MCFKDVDRVNCKNRLWYHVVILEIIELKTILTIQFSHPGGK